MQSRVRVTSHKSLCLSCEAKKEEETLKLLAAAFSGLHWWDGWCLFPPQPPASHPTPSPAPGLPCRPGRGFLKWIDWAHCKLYASADQLAREKGWLRKARATERGAGRARLGACGRLCVEKHRHSHGCRWGQPGTKWQAVGQPCWGPGLPLTARNGLPQRRPSLTPRGGVPLVHGGPFCDGYV